MIVFQSPLVQYAFKSGAVDESVRDWVVSDIQTLGESDRVRMFKSFETSALGGSAFSMCMCSRLAREGIGTSPSPAASFTWACRAASMEFPPGYFELGLCYEGGIGVAESMQEAISYYAQSADLGFGFAAYRLALLHHVGDRIPQDSTIAIKLIKRASCLGESMAAGELAVWYESGDGVEKNAERALEWYLKAADLGDPFSIARLAAAYMNGELGLPRSQAKAEEYRARIQ